MSARNRPRGSIAKEDFTDELNLWNSIVEKVRRAQALDVKYEEIQARIGESDQTIPDDERKSSELLRAIVSNNEQCALGDSWTYSDNVLLLLEFCCC